ncbi:MAG TPA: hypothetical protein VHL80_02085 [Polyangia bacterium]|nr:hypothetical protein [Polyangia bacterium]
MKGLLLSLATAALVVGAVYLLKLSEPEAVPSGAPPGEARIRGEEPSAGAGAAGAAREGAEGSLRDRLLRTSAKEAGVEPVRGVWGVVMERGYPKGVATVIALADGTASLHLSNGGSVLGGREYPPARMAARTLCERAADSLGGMVAAQEFPRPAEKRVRFYVLTTDGVRAAEGDLLAHLRDGGRDPLEGLMGAGDAVVEALKDATNKGLLR